MSVVLGNDPSVGPFQARELRISLGSQLRVIPFQTCDLGIARVNQLRVVNAGRALVNLSAKDCDGFFFRREKARQLVVLFAELCPRRLVEHLRLGELAWHGDRSELNARPETNKISTLIGQKYDWLVWRANILSV